MRFLLVENLSPRLADIMREAGVAHDAGLGLKSAPDIDVSAAAVAASRILVSADTDFGALLAQRHSTAPSLLLLRRAANRRAVEQASLILDNLAVITEDLDSGAIVVLGERTIRIRHLPI